MNLWDALKPEQVGQLWQPESERVSQEDVAWLERQMDLLDQPAFDNTGRDFGDETDHPKKG